MDLGATICTPKKPACVLCPWMRALRGARARRSGELSAQGGEEDRRAAPRRRVRRGARGRSHSAAHAAREGPARRHDRSADDANGRRTSTTRRHCDAPLRRQRGAACSASVTHTSSRIFRSQLDRLCGERSEVARERRIGTRWVPSMRLPREALPNVMRKVIAHALGSDALRPRPESFSKTRRAPPR